MSGLISWLNSLGDGFVFFTIRMLIQSSVLILILLLLDWVLRCRVRAVVRYWIWLLVLAKLVLPPSLSSPTSLVSWIGGRLPEATIVSRVPAPATEVREAVPHAPPALMEMTPAPVGANDYSPLQGIARAPAPSAPSAASTQPVVLPTWRALVLLAWMAAVVIMVVLLIQRVFFVRALLAQSQEAPGALGDLLEQCRRDMGVHRVAGVRLTGLSASPSVCGLLRPVILMPEPMARQLDMPQLRSVLFHELAHIQRGDLWINLLQTLLQIVYLYHPLLWWANARIRAIREQAVDEAVLAALGEEAEEYPRTLLSISKLAFGTPSLSLRLLGVVESKRALTARIRHMVSRPFPQNARLGLLGLAAIAVIAAVLLPMASGREGRVPAPSSDKPAESPTAVSADGVTVELLGLREYRGTGELWWRADGTPIPGEGFPEFKTTDPAYNDPQARVRVVALRLTSPSLRDVSLSWSFTNACVGSTYVPRYEDDQRKVLRPVQTLVSRFADDAVTTDLKVGIAAGVWKEAAAASEGRTASARDNITQSEVIYHPVQEKDGTLIVTATHLLGWDYDCRIVGEDESHRVFEPVRYSNQGDKMRLCTSVLDVPRSQVRWFRLQARPYQWVELKNVHLMPKSPAATDPAGEPSRQSMASSAAERIIHFPRDRSPGLLSLRDPGAHLDEWEGWREKGQARGDTPIPEGTQRRLSITEKTYENLADLAALRADDIQYLDIHCPQLQDDDLRHLKGLIGLQSLTLSSSSSARICPMTGAGLAYLKDLKALRHLRILFTQLNDENLRHLEPLRGLEDLALWNDEQIRGEGLVHLKSLPVLRSLSFYMVPVENAGLEKLKGMEQLESLSLQYTHVTDEGLVQLRGLPALKSLVLPPATTDAGLAHLKGLASLTGLSISDAKVTDDGLALLKEMPALTSVSISCREMNGRGLKYLRDMPRLKKIGLMYNQMNDAGMEGLKGLMAVTSLYLRQNPITDSGLANLEGLTALEYLCLKSTPITDAGLAQVKGLTSLKILDLAGTRITDAGLESLKDLTCLQTLWLQETDIGDAGLAHLKELKALDTLYLDHTYVNDAGLIHLRGFPSLRRLTLNGTVVAGDGLVHLKDCRSLRHLSVRVPGLSQAGLRYLKEMTWLQELALGEGSISEKELMDLTKALPDCAIDMGRIASRPQRPAPALPAGQPMPARPPDSPATSLSTAKPAGGVIAGVVVDSRGAPIAGASVTIENKDLLLLPQPEKIGAQIRRVIRADSTQTDSEGRFRFTDLTPGKTPITIAATGYRTEFALSTATGTEDLRVVLGEPRPYRHSGVVADISCRPVAGVEVTFLEETLSGPGKGKDAPPVTVRTDERGQYRFDRLLPPVDRQSVRRFLYARKAGYGVWGCEPDTTGGQATGIIRLMAEEKVSGVVKDEVGAPIAGATVWLSAGWGYFGSVRFTSTWQHLAPQTTTGADGSFTLGQLPTDSDLSLQVRAEGFASDGAWPIRTGKFGSYATRRGDTTTVMSAGGEPNTPLMITLQRASAVAVSNEPVLPPGATTGKKTEWPISAGGNGHFYQGVRMPKPLPWNEADRLAKLLGGHLVTITSAAENDFVFRLIDDDTYWYHSYNWRGPWLGAVQPPGSEEPAGGWTWITGEPFTFTRWDAEQPNNFNGSPENRVHFGNQRSRIPTWNDVRENFEEVVSFVVEWEPAQQPAWIEWPVAQGGNGHFYQVVRVTQGLTWDEANAAAQAQGGYLATITSAEENAFVFALIQDLACWNGPRGPWIGGFQTPGRPVREDWHWVTGEPFEYNHWSPGQPNDGGGADETRLEYGWGATTIADTWNDQPAGFRGVYAYVVEREPGGPTQAAAKLNAWVSLQVLEERVVVLDTLKPFSDYWPKKRHQVVGALSEKETLDYLRRRLQDKESLPIRIHVYFPPETRSAAEDLRQQIFALAREANAERDIDVRLEPSAYVGSGESPFYLREGKITTFYPHIMPRPDGGPKPITSGLVEPDDLEQHILWRLTMPKNLPLTFRIEYDEASSALAKQVADTAKAVAKRVGLTDLVGVTGALVEPVPESAFLGKWQTLGNGVIQSLDIQSAGVCQVTMGEGSEAIKPGTSVKGTWAWTVKEVLLDINDHIRGSSTMPSYVYRATVNGEGNLVIQRGEIWPQGSFMHPRPPEMVFKKVQ